MNNSNPFVPQGSLLDQQSKRRSRMKLGVFCVLAVGVTALMAMLIQGCKREQAPDTTDNGMPPAPTNDVAMTDTNPPPLDISTNPPVAPTNPPVVINPPPVEPVGTEYVVIKGDSLAKIAKKNGVTLKALEAANPGVVPTKLKVGQKLSVPASTSTPSVGATPASASEDTASEAYVVKSGDTLTKIAKAHGTTVKAIMAANNLTTKMIKVGKKLKIPVKAEAAAPAPVVDTAPVPPAPAPVTEPVVSPSPAPVK
jgi:LysM repeat protein